MLILGLLFSGCVVGRAAVVRDPDSERIDRDMAHEVFSQATPGAQGIALAGAPPLAKPFPPEINRWQRGVPAWGWGSWGGGWPTGRGYRHHGAWSPRPWR